MKNPEVVAAAPFIATQALLSYGNAMQGTAVRGIDPAEEVQGHRPGAPARASCWPR
jgi:lipoprotein-releasing system permease protein